MSMFNRRTDEKDHDDDEEVAEEKILIPRQEHEIILTPDIAIDRNNSQTISQNLMEFKSPVPSFRLQTQANRLSNEYYEFISQDYNNQIRDSKSVVNPEQCKAKLMMFSDNEEIPKFQKEELKEEEKEFLQQPNLNDSDENRNSQSHYEDDEVIENEENDQEMEDIPIDDRIAASTPNHHTNRDNLIQNRAEILSTVENLSNTAPCIQIENEYHQNTAAAIERRMLNQLIGQSSVDDSDFDDAEDARMNSGNTLEEQIEIIMANFMSTVNSERNQISELK